MEQRTTKKYLLDQCRRYPALRPEDLLKFLHQSVFGCGHFVQAEGGMAYLRQELANLAVDCPAETEPLDGGFARAHLGLLRQGLRPETLFRLFYLSGQEPCGSVEELEQKLAVLQTLADAGELPFSGEAVAAAAGDWRRQGFPVCHHSEAFRRAYAPAYRVIQEKYVWLLPLLTAIDRILAEKQKAVLAIEGGAGSGKSTLADTLREIYGCTVFHADDYFLRPEQRTRERMEEIGGNMDRERLETEILRPLKDGKTVVWRRYDCCTQSLCPVEEASPAALTVVEGSYSMHPRLAGYYDLSVFLRVDPALQVRRIRDRNSTEMAQRFFDVWLPMENRYFEQTDTAGRCDLILEVKA